MKSRIYTPAAIRRYIFASIIAVATASSTGYAASPFQTDDFVSISQLGGLEVQKTEITYSQYDALNNVLPIENQAPWKASNCYTAKDLAKGFGPNFPAACISYEDAEAFVRTLNGQDRSYIYRLPTDHEMEILVEMTLGRLSNEELSAVAWFNPMSEDKANEVCTKKPVFGLCDILGNLWEWSGAGPDSIRVLRGGGLNFYAQTLRGAYIDQFRPSGRLFTRGFRLVRTAK